MPRQESVVASLHELRAIEQQRIADEIAARAAHDAACEARRVAEQARLDADARAVRDAALAEAARIEHEAAAARRADELAIACAEAAERARAQAELDAERMAEEMRVRREQVARTRPRALIAVIAALVIGGAALGVLLVQQSADLAARNAAIRDVTSRADKLHQDSDELARAARSLQDEVDKRESELAAQQRRIAALQAVVASTPHPVTTPHVVAPIHVTAPPPIPRPPVVLDPSCAGSVLCK